MITTLNPKSSRLCPLWDDDTTLGSMDGVIGCSSPGLDNGEVLVVVVRVGFVVGSTGIILSCGQGNRLLLCVTFEEVVVIRLVRCRGEYRDALLMGGSVVGWWYYHPKRAKGSAN